jgi:hypothetical protein
MRETRPHIYENLETVSKKKEIIGKRKDTKCYDKTGDISMEQYYNG